MPRLKSLVQWSMRVRSKIYCYSFLVLWSQGKDTMYTNGVNKEMDDIEVDGLIPHVQSKTFTVNGDENNDVKFSETDSSAAPGNNERNRYQRLSNQDSKQLFTVV
uniref:Uncharacterized protein n=1 Tax=Magallana gigas TaxID=29159 RepID=K1PYN2_MAGGI